MIVLRIAVVIFVVELLIMSALAALDIQSEGLTALLDAVVLTAVSSVVIHCWIIRSYVRSRDVAEGRVRVNEERWKFALEGAGAGVWELEVGKGEVFHSKRCREILGLGNDDSTDTLEAWRQRIHPDDLPRVLSDIQPCLDGTTDSYRCEHRMLAGDGSWKWIVDSGLVVSRDAEARPLRLIGTHADITVRKQAEDELRSLAVTDALTGLFNRRHFMARMQDALALRQRLREQPVSVLMLDIDHFKRVNDTHGHPVGDAVLRHFAGLVAGQVRKTDTVGRLGGEEFAIVLLGTDVEAARAYAKRLLATVADTPFQLERLLVPVTASIGLSSIDLEDDSIDAVLERVDQALYSAKRAGRNRVHVDTTYRFAGRRGVQGSAGFVKLIWREAYNCGDPEIDAQHRALFDSANSLLTEMLGSAQRRTVASMIENLLADIAAHFEAEENQLRSARYGDLDAHSRMHRQLIRRAQGLVGRHRRHELEVGELFGFFAYDVVARHMLVEDRKFHSQVRAAALEAARH